LLARVVMEAHQVTVGQFARRLTLKNQLAHVNSVAIPSRLRIALGKREEHAQILLAQPLPGGQRPFFVKVGFQQIAPIEAPGNLICDNCPI
jgi:hypothetical protein